MKLYEIKRPTCRSVRDLLFVIIVLACTSALVTYQLNKYLPIKSQPRLSIKDETRLQLMVGRIGRLDTYESSVYAEDKSRRGLEGIYAEEETESNDRSTKHRTDDEEQLLNRIKQVEQRLDWTSGRNRRLALVDKRYHMYEDVLHSSGFDITRDVNSTDDIFDTCFIEIRHNSTENVLPSNCRQMNHIPALYKMVKTEEAFCRTMEKSLNIPHFKKNPLSPRCYVLPENADDFLTSCASSKNKWLIKPLSLAQSSRKLLVQGSGDMTNAAWLRNHSAVVQEYFENPLLLRGATFDVKLYVLVTSASPLRAYVHSCGIVQRRYGQERNFEKIRGDAWNLERLKEYLSHKYGSHIAAVAFRNMYSVILQTLLFADAEITCDYSANENLSEKAGFQLLEFSIVLNSHFQPAVLKFNPATHSVSKNIVEDVITMTTAYGSVAKEIAAAFAKANLIYNESECLLDEGCLNPDDVVHILRMAREHTHRSAFNILYPRRESEKYIRVMKQLHSSCAPLTSQHYEHPTYANYDFHSTLELHSTVLAILSHLNNRQLDGHSYTTPSASDTRQNRHLKSTDYTHHSKRLFPPNCSKSFDDIGLLQSLHTMPDITFSPNLSPNSSEYYVTVPYDVILVQISALALSCYCEARFDDKYGISRASNYTLGLGSNSIYIHIVDITHSRPWTVNTYTLHIYRQYPGVQSVEIMHTTPCSVIQNCDFKYISDKPCGLQVTRFKTWHKFIAHRETLPSCPTGDAPGEWVVPCRSCNSANTCDWSQATWHPYHCAHKIVPRQTLKKCLQDKQILFIGDSTNRGIMHYLMEQVNGSLTEWDKTHDMKFYSNLNGGRTRMSFAYYPQFWLPTSQKPVFDKALYQLIQMIEPLENSRNTVIVVGGVHWLATHHLNVLRHALRREGLANAQVIVKTLGAGFHQPVDGLHCLTMKEQRKLLRHNRNLVDVSRDLNYTVVDTFNMTMARYKDFLQGKCACHFHTVKEVLPSFTQLLKTQTSATGVAADIPITFHVEGEINRIYSEILISTMCGTRA